jgi:hypothetical protein
VLAVTYIAQEHLKGRETYFGRILKWLLYREVKGKGKAIPLQTLTVPEGSGG